MPKLVQALGAQAVKCLKLPGYHAVGEVAGLNLQITPSGARSWVLRLRVGAKRREIGLGAYPGVSLADARVKAQAMRDAVRDGRDPLLELRAARSALIAEQASAKTFRQCADAYIAAHEAGWKNAKHSAQWRNTLATYVHPTVGELLVRDVTKDHVLSVLRPMWTAKPETAARVRSRVELVLSYAMQAGYRPEGANPARWRGGLDKLLPARSKVARVVHHRALPVGEVGAFYQRLRGVSGMGARALEFAILTAARSGEVRGATWAEIDVRAKTWTVPADRMKAGKEHRVPLSDAAVALLRHLGADGAQPGMLVFPAPRGGELSDMTLTAVTRRMGTVAVPHGFRSTFRDWAGERTAFAREVAEAALAHALDSKVEAAYARGDLFAKRVKLMQAWADFLQRPASGGAVVELATVRAGGA